YVDFLLYPRICFPSYNLLFLLISYYLLLVSYYLLLVSYYLLLLFYSICFQRFLLIISFIVELSTPNFSASSTCLNSLNSHKTLISITSSGVSLLPLTSSPLEYLDVLISFSFFLYFNNPVSIACLIFSAGVTHSKLSALLSPFMPFILFTCGLLCLFLINASATSR